MRYRLLPIIISLFSVSLFAGQSPRFQTLEDSTVEKKPILEVVKSGVEKFRAKGDTLKPAEGHETKPRVTKRIVTTIILPTPELDPTITDPDSAPPSSLRSAAAAHVLFDLPIPSPRSIQENSTTPEPSPDTTETQADSTPLPDDSLLTIDTTLTDSLLSDSTIAETDSSDSVYDGDTTIRPGDKVGYASWYGPGLQGKRTSSGERFDMKKMTAAHRSLPFGTIVEITNMATGKSVRVRINDRGPHRKDRMIDLSKKAAQKIGVTAHGFAKVKMRIIQ